MLLYIKLSKKYNKKFLDLFFSLLSDHEAYAWFQVFLKTQSIPASLIDLLDCGFAMSFNTALPDSQFLEQIHSWFTFKPNLSSEFYIQFSR